MAIRLLQVAAETFLTLPSLPGTSSEYLALVLLFLRAGRASITMASAFVPNRRDSFWGRAGTEDVDQVAFNFTGDWQRFEFRDRGFYRVVIGLKFNMTVVPNRVAGPSVTCFRLTEAARIGDDSWANGPNEG